MTEFVIDASVRVTWILLAVLLLLGAMRRSSAAMRHGLCLLALLAVILLPIVKWLGPTLEVGPWATLLLGPARAAEEAIPPPRVAWPGPEPKGELVLLDAGAAAILALHDLEPVRSNALRTEPIARPSTERASAAWSVVAWVWLAGSSWFLLRALTGLVLVHLRWGRRAGAPLPDALRREADLPSGVPVRVVPSARQPVTVGILRAHVVVPEEFLLWSSERRRAVLAHEVAHLRRRDGLSLLTWLVARALWWPHPLIWSCGRILALSRERACDDLALRCGVGPTAYARHLVDIARSLHPLSSTHRGSALAMLSKSDLEQRVQALLTPRVARTGPGPRARIVAILAVAGITGMLGVAEVSHAQTPTTATPSTRRGTQESAGVPRRNEVEPIQIAITRDGAIHYGGSEIGVGGVEPLVRILTRAEDRALLVRCDPEVSSALLVQVIDQAKLGGAVRISLATTKPKGTAPGGVPGSTDAAASLRRVGGSDAEEALSISALDAPPRVLRQVQPVVTEELASLGSATVWLLVLVNRDGKVSGLKVQKSTDPRFERAALEAAERWQFEPGRKDGEPAPFRLRLPIRFGPAVDTVELPSPRTSLEDLLAGLERKRGELAEIEARIEAALAEVRANSVPQGGVQGSQAGSLVLEVRDGSFDCPLAGARVEIVERGLTQTLGESGAFEFRALPPGSYTVRVAKKGYESAVLEFLQIEAGRRNGVKIVLRPEFEPMDDHVVGPRKQ